MVPRLWDDTIETHRQAVRDATLDAAASVARERGPASVTMSAVAEKTGIGRATLYKYFAGVEEILMAWHERQVNAHLEHLTQVGTNIDVAAKRLEAVLAAYARLAGQHRGNELAALLHSGDHVTRAEEELHHFIGELIAAGAEEGHLRSDVAAVELAGYCLHAMTAAGELSSQAAVGRLVSVTLDGLRAAPSR